MRATNNQLIAVNATGCLEVFSTPYPESSWQIPWIHSLFGNAAAVASGVAAAMRVTGRTNTRVVAQGGDGGTTDIGFGCLSGMFERNDDVLYICYDNEAYMNTGVQRSSATPPTARTATTMAVGKEPGNVFGTGKNVPLIAMAHFIPYVATASVANLRDLEFKVTKAMAMHGARYIHIHVPCPLGWGSAPADTIKLARLAVETGLFPLFEAEHGEITGRTKIRRQVPVEDYLKLQKRFAHLFGPKPDEARARAHPGERRPQHRQIRPARLSERIHGKAVRDHPRPRLEPGQQDRLVAHVAADVPRPAAALQPCLPGRREHPGLALSTPRAATTKRAWRLLTADNPFPAIMGRVCYHPCEGACNRGKLDESVGINSVERFLGDEAIKHGWQFAPPAFESGKHVLVVGAGPSGLSAAYHLRRLGHRVKIIEAGPMAGGMMRFGIPKYRLPRDVLDAEVKRILDMGVVLELNRKVSNILETMQEGQFDAAFLAVGAHIAKRAYIPAGEAAHMLDAVSVLRGMEGEDKPMLGRRVVVYGGGNTALDVARTAKRLGASEAIIVYRRNREKMPAHDFEVEEALQEGVLIKWLSTIKNMADEGTLTVEKMELDDKGFPQPTGEFETLEADSLVLALGQDVDLSLLDGVPGLDAQGRHRRGRPQHDDRPCRASSPAATWCPPSAR